MSFKGFGFMHKGVLHGGPAIFLYGDGDVISYSKMLNGRGFGIRRFYCPQDTKQRVTSNESTDISGFATSVTEIIDSLPHGRGMCLLEDGRIFLGERRNGKLAKG